MKKTLLIFISCLVFTLCIFAHPGRTDANGGHWNRKTGEYHFHSGEYAGRTQSSSSSDSDDLNFIPPYEPPTENRSAPKNKKMTNAIAITFVSLFIIGRFTYNYFRK